jgi:hypothetical protein
MKKRLKRIAAQSGQSGSATASGTEASRRAFNRRRFLIERGNRIGHGSLPRPLFHRSQLLAEPANLSLRGAQFRKRAKIKL